MGLSIYDGKDGSLVGKETYDDKHCNLCGKPVKKSYAVIYREEDGIETDVTINREGPLCRRCAKWDMKFGLTFDEDGNLSKPINQKFSIKQLLSKIKSFL